MQKLHKILGLVMLLPFVAWTLTGIFFFFKPGYQAAYQAIEVELYPLERIISLPENSSWLEVRQLRTSLGHHLLVKDPKGWHQLDVNSFEVIEHPTKQQLRQLVTPALTQDKARYGEISKITGETIETTTGVNISVNWPQMTLRQKGRDTDFINTLYNIHYLRWTGIKAVDQYLGVIGLLCVSLLAFLGTWMTLKRTSR